jgi:nucleotide-binding universal stress UspA family protein
MNRERHALVLQIDDSIPFIESVVHATDFSPASERAFAHALAIAAIRRARLEILHVGTERETDWQRFPQVRGVLERWGLLPPGSSQANVAEKLGVQVTKVSIASRFPAVAVATRLAEQPADLLVVATEGRDGAARWGRGSVAEAMSRWSRTMTLFVPNELDRSIVSVADGRLTLKNILIPVDHSPDANSAIDFAVRIAAIAGDDHVAITLLHIGAEGDLPRVRAVDGDGWSITWMRRDGNPVAEIAAASELVKADLLVMPTAGRSGVFEALGGSTTERVLRAARCALLAVPAGYKSA